MQPKKSLGQNFLRDEEILEKIISVSDLKSDDFVIEIGPGEGVLTEKLLKNAGKIIAIEKDDYLSKKLNSRFKNNKKIEIINDDILRVNLPKLLASYKLPVTSYKVIANIPYYITSPIIQLFLETQFPPSEMILMVQKEVAERICASVGQMSILAVSVQYYAKPELLFKVSRKSFWPAPEVDSAVIRITPFPSPPTPLPNTGEEGKDNKHFFKIVKAGFCAKRKTLLNNLSSSLQIEKKEVEEILKKAGIKPTQRAQELSVGDWKNIATLIYE
jgi:16S rRNA (adenine1518-N6/adenine1519-N6)-dimethyltransferase